MQVCELDIIFNFEKAYFILDEFLMGGEIQDTSKKSVLKAIEQADLLQEVTWASPTTVCGVLSLWLAFRSNFLSLFWGGKESGFYISAYQWENSLSQRIKGNLLESYAIGLWGHTLQQGGIVKEKIYDET